MKYRCGDRVQVHNGPQGTIVKVNGPRSIYFVSDNNGNTAAAAESAIAALLSSPGVYPLRYRVGDRARWVGAGLPAHTAGDEVEILEESHHNSPPYFARFPNGCEHSLYEIDLQPLTAPVPAPAPAFQPGDRVRLKHDQTAQGVRIPAGSTGVYRSMWSPARAVVELDNVPTKLAHFHNTNPRGVLLYASGLELENTPPLITVNITVGPTAAPVRRFADFDRVRLTRDPPPHSSGWARGLRAPQLGTVSYGLNPNATGTDVPVQFDSHVIATVPEDWLEHVQPKAFAPPTLGPGQRLCPCVNNQQTPPGKYQPFNGPLQDCPDCGGSMLQADLGGSSA